MPHSVHRLQNAGSPVASRPAGAVPGAAGVTMASQRSKISSKPSFSSAMRARARW
jgi:hypothetical protein